MSRSEPWLGCSLVAQIFGREPSSQVGNAVDTICVLEMECLAQARMKCPYRLQTISIQLTIICTHYDFWGSNSLHATMFCKKVAKKTFRNQTRFRIREWLPTGNQISLSCNCWKFNAVVYFHEWSELERTISLAKCLPCDCEPLDGERGRGHHN